MTQYYFICTVRFNCPACGFDSTKTLGTNSANPERNVMEAMVRAAHKHPICSVCGERAEGRPNLKVDVESVTFEQFTKAGFSSGPQEDA